jgi:RHS repeat-associated protein
VRRSYYPDGQLATDTLRVRTWTVTGAATDFDSHVYPLAYTYDLDGRRATLRHPGSIAPKNGTTGATYDLEQYAYEPGSGALASVTGVLGTQYRFFDDADMRTDSIAYPGGRFSRMTYDADGRILTRQDSMPNWVNGGGGHQLTVQWMYDQRGKATDVEDDHSHIFTYSMLGSLTYVEGIGGHPKSPSDVTNNTYTVDALGRRLQEQRFGTSAPTLSDYDGAGRLSSSHPPAGVAWAGTAPLEQNTAYDAAGNQEWFYQENFPTSMVDGTRSYFGGDQKLRAADRQACYAVKTSSGPDVYACKPASQLDNGSSGSFEWYRYDALGRRVLVRTRRDKYCTTASCASTITRFVWDGDQILYEIRAPGGAVSDATLEDDIQQGNPFYGRVAYTHGGGIDQPLEIIRMGWTPSYDSSYGLSTWNGPYPVIPYEDWHAMAGATTWTGKRLPCAGTPDLCSTGIWPASSLSAFYDPTDPINQQAWFGSLTSGQSDGSNFMYMRNRYYNPQTGTFTQPDPIGVAGGLNVYGYAEGDPVGYTDPLGLCPCDDLNPRELDLQVETAHTAAAHPLQSAGVVGAAIISAWGGLKAAALISDGLQVGRLAYRRPYIRQWVRQAVEAIAPRDEQGKFLDANTGQPIEGRYDLGHRRGNEFHRELARARSEGLTQRQFNDRMNHPDLYQIEDPKLNRSHAYERKP